MAKDKRVQLIDLLNDLEKEEEVSKRIKENLEKHIDPFPLFYGVGNYVSSMIGLSSTSSGW